MSTLETENVPIEAPSATAQERPIDQAGPEASKVGVR